MRTNANQNFNALFWDIFDLSLNVDRVVQNIATVRTRAGNIVWLICNAILAFTFCWLAYRFDLLPTYNQALAWSKIILAGVVGAPQTADPALVQQTTETASSVVGIATYLIFGLTLMPSLVEMTAAKFAPIDFKIYLILFWMFLIFDFVTDYPEVKAFVRIYDPYFTTITGGSLLRYLALFGMLLMSTIGFEMLAIVFLVGTIASAFRITQEHGSRQ